MKSNATPIPKKQLTIRLKKELKARVSEPVGCLSLESEIAQKDMNVF